MRIAHIITDLDVGGAETMLTKLLEHTDRSQIVPAVCCLQEAGELAGKIRAMGIAVHSLGWRRGKPDFRGYRRLIPWLRDFKPDVVQTWMYHADLIGGWAARRAGITRLAWGIRQTNLSPRLNRRSTLAIARLCALLSRYIPARIVCCSEATRRSHIDFGYSADRMCVLPNGFDLERFQPDEAAGAALRNELKLPLTTPLIGLIARFNPQKDHHNFFRAAAAAANQYPDVHFVLCGEGISRENQQIRAWVDSLDIGKRTHLLGKRSDVARIAAGIDLLAQSSLGEGFPNVVGEAMACATPCAATRVGETEQLVGDTGWLAPPGDSHALAAAFMAALSLSPAALRERGQAARRRIEQHYSIQAVTQRYHGLYREMA